MHIFVSIFGCLLSKASTFQLLLVDQHWHSTMTDSEKKKKKKKKDTVRLIDAEGLPKVWGWATPILNSDLCIGGSARTHLFCWIFFYSNQASSRLQRGQWMLLPGHLFETRFPPVSRTLSASPSSALAYTFLQVSRVVVEEGVRKPSLGAWWEGRQQGRKGRAGVGEGGYWQGEQKGSWKL